MLNTVDIVRCEPLSDKRDYLLMEGRKEISCKPEYIRASQPDNPTDRQHIPTISFTEYVKSATALSQYSDYISERTIISFNSIPGVASDSSFVSDERNIRNWLANIIRKGTAPLTLRRYLGKLHALYTDYSGTTDQGEALFASLRENLSEPSLWCYSRDEETLSRIKDLPSKLQSMSPEKSAVAKALLYLLCLGGASYSSVSELRFSDQLAAIDQLQEIVGSMPKERRTYVFPFRHGSVRQGQLYREMTAGFTDLLTDIGIHLKQPFSAEILRGWWIEIALECGISCEEIVGMINSIPNTHRWLEIVRPVLLSEDEKITRLRSVANHICDATPRWYAMFMRDNNTPDAITDTVSTVAPAMLGKLQFFYPTHKIKKEKDGKKRSEEVPFIPHILFFKSRPDVVKPLFERIGNLAWCFKTTNRPNAPYAVISKQQMDNFQKCIGVLDDSVKMEFVQNPDLVPDRHIRITGGVFKGYEGTIYRQNGMVEDADMRYFILKINDQNNIVWKVRIEESFIEPLNDE